MQTIHDIYQGYDFSSTRCYVIVLEIGAKGYTKIDHKLPGYVRHLKGIFFNVNTLHANSDIVGYLSLNFNGQALQNIQCAIPAPKLMTNNSQPLRIDEYLEAESRMQGYFYDPKTKFFPYNLSIYLHYTSR